jgi:hypothetical protein
MTYNANIKLCDAYYDSEYDFSNITEEVIHPNDWIIYKFINENKNNYVLCLDYLSVKCGYTYSLSLFDIYSDNDNINMIVSDDKQVCEIFTKKYKYIFKKSDEIHKIENSLKGFYNATGIKLISINKLFNNENSVILQNVSKYHFELESDILNFYQDGKYIWSKIISLRYTDGIYFVTRDKIFAVIENGCGELECFNLDGTHYKTIQARMEYIRNISIIEDETEKEKYLKLRGFYWGPHYVKQIIQIDSLFTDKLKGVEHSDNNIHSDDSDEDEKFKINYYYYY